MSIKIEGYHLSPQQQRIWSMLESDNCPLYTSVALRIQGETDSKTLEACLRDMIFRNEILRTTFREIEGMKFPLQVISEESKLSIETFNLSHMELDSDQQRDIINENFEGVQNQSFDLANGPLIKAQHLILDDKNNMVIIHMSAMCSDFFMDPLLEQFKKSYETVVGYNREDVSNQIQYVSVSEWLNEIIHSEEANMGREYWAKKRQIEEFKLYSDFHKSENPNVVWESIDKATVDNLIVAEDLHHLYKTYNVTPEAVLLTCWFIFLQRFSGTEQIVVGYAQNGRNSEDLIDVLGPLTKHVPISIEIQKEITFIDLARLLEQEISESEDWQECFIWDTESIIPGFEYIKPSATLSVAESLNVSASHTDFRYDSFDIRLRISENSEHLNLSIDLNDVVYERASSKYLSFCLRNLAVSAINSPMELIDNLSFFDAEQEKQIIQTWQSSEQADLKFNALHYYFETQAGKTPEYVAVLDRENEITFKNLNNKANQIGNYLISSGVQKGDIVGIYMERSQEMVAAILAILKAGGIYLPLDPAYPQERISFMLENSGVSYLLINSDDELDTSFSSLTTIDLRRDSDLITLQPTDNLCVEIKEEDHAYVIYTSGSTGIPKGVLISHRAICNHMEWFQEEFKINPKDKVLQKTSYSFDASVWEFFAPLMSGAQLVLASPGLHADPSYLIKTMIEQEISIVQFVPTMLDLILDDEEFARCKHLRLVFSGGEPLKKETIKQFKEIQSAQLVNLYGPTECCIDSSFWIADQEISSEIAPIGQPIYGTGMYILDTQMNLLPYGIPGELYISGKGLSTGYLNRSELTEKVFVTNPFSVNEDCKLYKTGDKAKYTPINAIHVLGRLDNQVKIRGYRIELGEIEQVLLQHPDVNQSVVITDDQAIISYVSTKNSELTEQDLQEYVQRALPFYMLPKAIILMDQFPVLPNGKLDRNGLPKYTQAHAYIQIEASTPTEKVMEKIWKEVLNLEKVGVNENFFTLGGDSIKAIKIIAKANKEHIPITTKDLFIHQTIADLASIAPLRLHSASERKTVFQATPFLRRELDKEMDGIQASPHVFFIDLPETINAENVNDIIQLLRDRFVELTLYVVKTDNGWDMGCQSDDSNPIDSFKLDQDGSYKMEFIKEELLKQWMELYKSKGQMLYTAFIQSGDKTLNKIAIVGHRLLLDYYSWELIISKIQLFIKSNYDLESLDSVSSGMYSNWANKFYSELSSDTNDLFWSKQEEGNQKVTPLPIDYKLENQLLTSYTHIEQRLTEEETTVLFNDALETHRVTQNEILIASVITALTAWTQSPYYLLDIYDNARYHHKELESSIGNYKYHYPVLMKNEGSDKNKLYLKDIKEQLRAVPEAGTQYDSWCNSTSRDKNLCGRAQISYQYEGVLTPLDSLPNGLDSMRNVELINENYILNFIFKVIDNCLVITVHYREDLFYVDTINDLLLNLKNFIKTITLKSEDNIDSYSVTDFPSANLNENELSKLLNLLIKE